MRLLIVEDDKNLADVLTASLEAENFAVDVIADGEAGSFAARTNDYDLIILDLSLPGENGDEVCADIRKDGKNTPIIVLSATMEMEAKINLLNLGADDYMTKPFSFEELLSRVKAILRRPREIENEILQIGDIVLDLDNYSVKRGEEEICLTRKEFSLLEYLARNKGKALSRAMIMEHVWDVNADPFSNTVETHILNLRRKIGGGKNKNLIQTISGRGYRLG